MCSLHGLWGHISSGPWRPLGALRAQGARAAPLRDSTPRPGDASGSRQTRAARGRTASCVEPPSTPPWTPAKEGLQGQLRLRQPLRPQCAPAAARGVELGQGGQRAPEASTGT
ncbi:unnamed protein product [Prorocentrum cordatum]|uniref:Uncharacterized protein n=1 Tax=Prorocentrum cordatum TaxID=2364126 RepID=A0ABN9SA56_9DINO|nr:unnamed protein product [Polarella glacialis]